MPSVFLSHSSDDKPVVRKIADRLRQQGIRVWIDEAEIHVGESLIEKISEAIHDTDFVAAIISKRSVNSSWVQKELSLAMTKEISGKRVVVLPILIERCELPFFLSDKLYADLTSPDGFEAGLIRLIGTVKGLESAADERQLSCPAPAGEVLAPNEPATSEAIGVRVVGPDRPESAFTVLRDTKGMREVATVHIGGGLALMVLLFVLFATASPAIQLSLILFLLLAAGCLGMSGTLAKLSAAYFEEALHNDANLLLAIEDVGSFHLPFGATWRRQYALGRKNRMYRLGVWTATAFWFLQFIAILFLAVGSILLAIHLLPVLR